MDPYATLRELLAAEPLILTLSQASAFTRIPKSTLHRWCHAVPIMTAFGIEFIVGARALQRLLATKPNMGQASQDIEQAIMVARDHDQRQWNDRFRREGT